MPPVNDLAALGDALHSTLVTAQRRGRGAQALQAMTPIFAVGLVHAYRQLLLIAIDEELANAHNEG